MQFTLCASANVHVQWAQSSFKHSTAWRFLKALCSSRVCSMRFSFYIGENVHTTHWVNAVWKLLHGKAYSASPLYPSENWRKSFQQARRSSSIQSSSNCTTLSVTQQRQQHQQQQQQQNAWLLYRHNPNQVEHTNKSAEPKVMVLCRRVVLSDRLIQFECACHRIGIVCIGSSVTTIKTKTSSRWSIDIIRKIASRLLFCIHRGEWVGERMNGTERNERPSRSPLRVFVVKIAQSTGQFERNFKRSDGFSFRQSPDHRLFIECALP